MLFNGGYIEKTPKPLSTTAAIDENTVTTTNDDLVPLAVVDSFTARLAVRNVNYASPAAAERCYLLLLLPRRAGTRRKRSLASGVEEEGGIIHGSGRRRRTDLPPPPQPTTHSRRSGDRRARGPYHARRRSITEKRHDGRTSPAAAMAAGDEDGVLCSWNNAIVVLSPPAPHEITAGVVFTQGPMKSASVGGTKSVPEACCAS